MFEGTKRRIAAHFSENTTRLSAWKSAIQLYSRRTPGLAPDQRARGEAIKPVGLEEFKARYRGFRAYLKFCLACIGMEFLVLAFADGFVSALVLLAIVVVSLQIYFAGAFRLWAARQAIRHWEDKGLRPVVRPPHFINAILDDFMELFPVGFDYEKE